MISSSNNEEWLMPSTETELLLWRLFQSCPHAEQVVEFKHATIQICVPPALALGRKLLSIDGCFNDKTFGVSLVICDRLTGNMQWYVKNEPVLLEWIAFERLRTPDLLPQMNGNGTSYISNEEVTVDLSCHPCGFYLHDSDIITFKEWMTNNLSDDFTDFTVDFFGSPAKPDGVCTFMLGNFFSYGVKSQITQYFKYSSFIRNAIFVEKGVYMVLNMLLLSEMKRTNSLQLEGGYLDDLNLSSRRRDELTDDEIIKHQDILVAYLRSKLGDKLPVIKERLDWSFPYMPDCFSAVDKTKPVDLPKIIMLTGKLFDSRVLPNSNVMAA